MPLRNNRIDPAAPLRVAVVTDDGVTTDGVVRTQVWSTASLAWVRAQQAVLDAGTVVLGGAISVTTMPSVNVGSTSHPSGLGAVVDGRQVVTTAGTRVQMSAQACKSIAVTAETDNTGIIVVGAVTVVAAIATRQGLPLAAGATATFAVDNANRLYLDATVSGEGVTWIAIS